MNNKKERKNITSRYIYGYLFKKNCFRKPFTILCGLINALHYVKANYQPWNFDNAIGANIELYHPAIRSR